MSGSKILARGTVLVDPRKAVEKLRAHQLAQPGLYVLEVVRAAGLLGASELTLENDSDDLALGWEGAAPSASALLSLLDHLFDANDRALRLLAVAVNAALGLEPSFVDLYTTAHDPLPEDRVARVRYTARDGVMGEGVLELVPRTKSLPRIGFRLHVRERFGAAVMAEWLRREPAETALLRARLLAPRVQVARDGLPVQACALASIASVALESSAGLSGALHLVGPTEAPASLSLCELGVLLERRDLEPRAHAEARRARFPLASLPLHLTVDADALDTNISRSQVDLDRGLGAALQRRWPGALAALIREGLERTLALDLGDPVRHAGEEALLALVLWEHGPAWQEFAATGPAAATPPEQLEVGALSPALVAPLFDAPLVPTAFGHRTTLRAIASSPGRWVAWVEDSTLPEEFAPWLREVVWTPPRRAVLAALLSCVSMRNGARALAEARESMKRWRKLMAHPAGPVRVRRGATPTLRAGLADALTPEGVIGELTLHEPSASGGEQRITASVFVEGRAFCELDLGPSALPVRVAVQSPKISPRPSFDGVVDDDGLRATRLAVRARIVRVIAASLRAGGLDALSESARAAFVRAAWIEARGAVEAVETARLTLRSLAEGDPALYDAPAWPLTSGHFASTRELVAEASRPEKVMMFGPAQGGPRWDARPVCVLDPPSRACLEALLDPELRWVDMRSYLPARQSITPGHGAVASSGRGDYTWWTTSAPTARLSISPSLTSKSTLALMHSAAVVATRARVELLGPSVVALEDDAMVPVSDPMLSPAAQTLLAGAEFELAEALCAALSGDGVARESLGWSDSAARAESVRRFLLSALARIARMRGEHAPLRARIESVPLVPQRDASGGVRDVSVSSLREALARGEAPGYLFDPPPGLDGEAFAPLILATRELQTLVSEALEAKLASADRALRSLREARARRETRGRLQSLAAQRLDAPIEGAPATRLPPDGIAETAYGVSRALSAGRASVILDGVVVIDDALGPLPMRIVVRVTPRDESLFAADFRGLTKAGAQAVEEQAQRAMTHAALGVVERAERGEAIAELDREVVCAWIQHLGAKARSNADLPAGRVRAAALWLDPTRAAISIDNARVGKRGPRVILGWASPWLPPGAGEADDPPALSLAKQSELDAVRALCKGVIDDTAVARITQRRRAFLLDGARVVRLQGDPPAPWASARLDAELLGRCRGEVRLGARGAGAEVSVFDDGAIVSRVRCPSPIALEIALESPELDVPRAEQFVSESGVIEVALRLAREVLSTQLDAAGELPSWCLRAARWHLCTAGELSETARDRALFQDTLGRPMSLRDVAAQRDRFTLAGYVTAAPDEPVRPREAGRRVVVLDREEVGWLGQRVSLVDFSATLAEELAAQRWSRSSPARAIAVPNAPKAVLRAELRLERDGAEGEVLLLPWDAPDGSYAHWFVARRPLGRSSLSAPWPTLVALEAGSLTPRADHLGPLDNDAHREAVETASGLVNRVLAQELGPRPGESLASVFVHDGRSPAVSGGVAQAVGALWLTHDAAAGELRVHLGDAMVRVPARAWNDKARAPERRTAPISGTLWIRHAIGAKRELWEPMLQRLVAWSWRRLLDAWIERAQLDLGADHTLSHLILAGLADQLSGPAANVARRAALPGSKLTISRVVSLAQQGKTVVAREAGDPAVRDSIERVRARWFELLDAAGVIEERRAKVAVPQSPERESPGSEGPPAALQPTASPPAATPKAPATRAESLSRAALARLRAIDANVASLREIRVVERAPGGEAMGYEREAKRVWLRAEAPWVRAALEHPERDAVLVAMAALGEVNRALDEVTDHHEVSALRALLRAMAAGR